jgi:hypothetical protein
LPCKGTKKRKYIGSPAAIIQWVLGESGMLETMQPACYISHAGLLRLPAGDERATTGGRRETEEEGGGRRR